MTVANLEEGESRSFSGKGVAEEAVAKFRHAARQSPQHAGAGPDYAFECTPPANSCLFRLVSRWLQCQGFCLRSLWPPRWCLVRGEEIAEESDLFTGL